MPLVLQNGYFKAITLKIFHEFKNDLSREKIGHYTFQISPEFIIDPRSSANKQLCDLVKEYAQIQIGDRCLSLFCGTGMTSIYLSTLAKEVVGLENMPEAIRDANDNTRLNKIHNCTFICEDIEKWLNAFLSGSSPKTENTTDTTAIKQYNDFDSIVIDSPRTGLTKNLIELLSKIKFSRLTYISRNPSTFTQEVKLLEQNDIKLKKAQLVDLSLQTHQIVSVGLFV